MLPALLMYKKSTKKQFASALVHILSTCKAGLSLAQRCWLLSTCIYLVDSVCLHVDVVYKLTLIFLNGALNERIPLTSYHFFKLLDGIGRTSGS